MNLTLVKLGGSVITEKSNPHTPRPQIIHRLSQEIKSATDQNPKLNILIGHGSGSFGHTVAKQELAKQDQNTNSKIFSDPNSITKIHQAAHCLHSIVLEHFRHQGLNPITLNASDIVNGNIPPLTQIFSTKKIPILHGDIVTDKVTKMGEIFSTEQLFEILISHLEEKNKVDTIIMVTNIDGVQDPSGNIYEHITPDNFPQVKRSIAPNNAPDITGGMLHKISTAIHLAQHGITTHIINGNVPARLQSILEGKEVTRTTITQ